MSIAATDQNKLIVKYIPAGQPSPKGFIELVKTQALGTSKDGTPRPFEDLLYFLHVCKRTGLDPLAKQIYAVYRWDYRTGAEKITVQASIDGLRLIAQRSGQYGGQDDVKFFPEDESTIPQKATVTVYVLNSKTGERMPVTATARWNEYAQKGKEGKLIGLWEKMPFTMLGKCAEALAMRKAFPNELSGIYAEEEIKKEEIALPPPEAPVETMVTQEVDVAAMRNNLPHDH